MRVFFEQKPTNFRIPYPRLHNEFGVAYLLPKRGRRES